ncbi:MAG: hypothetical protein KGZ84_05475 [Erysipelotrichia bacterium]|jgi:hypothetical protein|nr:hypothetical protein [Erysipelotrichia bacterium]
MRRKKIILAFGVIVVVISAIVAFSLLREQGSAYKVFISHDDNAEYLIQGVRRDFQFVVKSDIPKSLIVTDSKGDIVDVRTSQQGNKTTIQSPQGGYTPGEEYQLMLPEGAFFENEDFQDARTIIFIVKKKEVFIEKFKESVQDLRRSQVRLLSENSAIIPLKHEVKGGDILLVMDTTSGTPKALKISNLSPHSDGQLAQFETPEMAEIYEELEIYKTFKLEAKDIIVYEDEIIRWIEEEGFLNRFMTHVGATEKPELKIEVKNKQGKIQVVVEMFPNPETTRLGLQIILEIVADATLQVDGLSNTNLFVSSNVTPSIRLMSQLKPDPIIEGALSFDEVNDWLDNVGSRVSMKTPKGKIFGVKFPMSSSSTVNLFIDFDIPVSFEASGGGNFEVKGQIDLGFALRCTIECAPYTSHRVNFPELPIELVGSYHVKSGIGLSAAVEFLGPLKFGGEVVVGMYASIDGVISSSNMLATPLNALGYYEFEFGRYHESSLFFYNTSNLIKYEYEYPINETKIPLASISNAHTFHKIKTHPMVLLDGKFVISSIDVEYYHVISRDFTIVPINQDTLKVLVNGSVLQKDGNAYLAHPLVLGKNAVTLQWVYHGNTYTQDVELELVQRLGEETLIANLQADEIVFVKEGYWSYKHNSKYGVVTPDGFIVPAIYDSHFFESPDNQICSYREGDFVGFAEDLSREVPCWGRGWDVEGYYYDTTKKWIYEFDYSDVLQKPSLSHINQQRTVIAQRVIVGSGASEEEAADYRLMDEYALLSIIKTESGHQIVPLTRFDFTDIRSVTHDNQNVYMVKAKNGLWGLLDHTGKTLIEPTYNQFVQTNGAMSHFSVISKGKYLVIDKNNTILIKGEMKEVFTGVYNNIFWIKRGLQWYVVNIPRG